MKRSYSQTEDSETEINIKEACKTFFTQVGEADALTYKCTCGTIRKKGKSGGWSNLWTHILADHPNYREYIKNSGSQTLDAFLHKKEMNIYGWLDWVIGESKPFCTVEKLLTRKYSKLQPISVETFLKYMNLVTRGVESVVCPYIVIYYHV